MAGIKSPSLRDLPTDDGTTPLARWVDNLPEKRGSMDPGNPRHAAQIDQMAQAIAQGLLDAPRVEKLARLNQKAAPVLLQALTMQGQVKARQAEMGQFFNPAQEKTILPARGAMESYEGDGNELSSFPARDAVTQVTPAKSDHKGAILAALKRGDVEYATKLKELFTKKDGEGPFAKINPKDYTPESVKRFQETQDYSVLTHLDPDKEVKAGEKAADLEGKLRGEYRGLSKTFLDVRDAHERIKESANDPSAAGDLALIFNYMKMLDPGSTVREGEFATAQNAAGIPERITAMYNKAISGERLAPATRADFVKRAGGLYKRQEATQKKNEKQYRTLAQRYKVNADRVVTDFNPDPEPKGAIGAPQEATKVINGKTYVKRPDGWYEQ
jgi:hypothetical protein